MRTIFFRALLALFALLFASFFGCGCNGTALKEEAKAAAKSVVDCTIDTAAKAIDEHAPALEQVIVDAIDGSTGKLDTERVLHVTKTYATDAAKCVLAQTIARLMRPPGPDAPQTAPIAVDFVGLHELRKARLGELRYKLPDGGTL